MSGNLLQTMALPAARRTIGEKYGFCWQQTMLRIKDPNVSVPFYERHFGMKLIHKYKFDEYGFSLYFLERPHDGTSLPTPGTPEAEKYLWNMKGVCLELTHNHGSGNDPNFKVNNGNVEPHRGFGHIAFNCPDVEKISAELEANGTLMAAQEQFLVRSVCRVDFQKRPHEGRMKTIAFAKDPDGYWIELCNRSPKAEFQDKFNLSQTMIRVKDPQKSLAFYRDLLGMTLLSKSNKGDFTVYFLAHLEPNTPFPYDPEGPEAYEFVKKLWRPVLELTHNHGTENDPAFKYHNGNDPPQGFGHIGLLCDDLEKACEELEAAGVAFRKRPHVCGRVRPPATEMPHQTAHSIHRCYLFLTGRHCGASEASPLNGTAVGVQPAGFAVQEGKMRGVAFALDPDGYSVELVRRGVTF